MIKDRFKVLLLKNHYDLKKAAKYRKDGIYVYAFIPSGSHIEEKDLTKMTNIYFRVKDYPTEIKKALQMVESSFNSENPIEIFPDALNKIKLPGREGFISFGKSARAILRSGFCLGKKIYDADRLLVNVIANEKITMSEINSEMEILYRSLDDDDDIYFGLQLESNRKETEFLVMGV